MKENIKILKSLIEDLKREEKLIGYDAEVEIQAIENLIKEFKKIKIENIEYKLGQTPDTTGDYKTLKKELEKWKKI